MKKSWAKSVLHKARIAKGRAKIGNTTSKQRPRIRKGIERA